ncbi:hypothetical protein TNCV_1808431 [Trichonephila clavipes]|nr:hypothetical protein TNCV_1808431 [Trichonephila clavipes]
MLIPFRNPAQTSFLDPSPLLCSNVSVQPIECLLSKRDLSANANHDIQPSQSGFSTNFGCLRNCSCNHASLSHTTHQSGDSLSLGSINIRPQSTTTIWDGGMPRVPFPNDVQ